MTTSEGESAEEPHGIVLDSCLVLNLYSTGRMEEIVRSLGAPVSVTDFTRTHEAKWVGAGRLSEPGSDVEMVDLSGMIRSACLREVKLDTEREADLLVEMVGVMDDGEAIAAAIATARNLTFGSDDKKARSILSRRVPPVRLLSTAQVIQCWAKRADVSPAVLGTALDRVRTRARFVPPSDDALCPWWLAAERLRGSE